MKFGTLVAHISYDLVQFKVILGSFGALVSKWPYLQKGVFVEQKSVKFTTRGH